ncbi:MAG: cell division protein FtsQ/DivIB [Faecalimonas sp.]|nr:cell division protein FtsQ/DivIB [Faecalimonas sp.]
MQNKKKKKKKKFGYYLYAAVALLLAIVNILLAAFLLTYVQNIRVYGTKYSKDSEVIAWIQEDPYTFNSIYTLVKFKSGAYELPSYLEDVKVGLQKTWELRVQVTEKEIVGCILSEHAYVYFAEDGTVMSKGSEIIEGIPVVEGLKVGETELYQKLVIGNEKVFSYVLEISEEMKKNALQPDRLVWENDSMNLYFDEVRVQLGKLNFGEKLLQLPPILEKLEGQKGTLHLEHYNEMSDKISFEKDTE